MPTNDHVWGPPWTIISILKWTTEYLTKHGVENPRASGEVILAHVLQCSRIDLYLRHDQPLQQGELVQFRNLIKRRAAREPVAYIVGQKEFWSLEFNVNTAVLIPRPETECLVEAAIRFFPRHSAQRVLELGCGSGAISVALAHERPDWRILALDKSADAIMVARENARHHHADHIRFMVGDWFTALGESAQFDLIVSNPPYIKTPDIDVLAAEIRNHEPRLALNGGVDGLGALAQIIRTAPRYLAPEGVLMTEIGSDQRPAVTEIVHQCNYFACVDIRKDYSGLERVAVMIPKRQVSGD
jgi:release factor glutamine methyltransferase